MKLRGTILLSLLVNVVLAVAILLGLGRPAPQAPEVATRTVERVNERVRITNVVVEVESPKGGSAHFNWRRVAAEDWGAYRSNLVAIGCPPATISLIMRSEITREFVVARAELLRGIQERFWEMAASMDAEEAFEASLRSPEYRELEKRYEADLKEHAPKVAVKDPALEELARQRRLESVAWIGEERREAYLQMLEAARAEERDFLKEIPRKERSSPENRSVKREIESRLDGQVAGLLSEEELEERRLRESGQAGWVRSVWGMELSEEEMKDITRIRIGFLNDASERPWSELSNKERAKFYNRVKDDLNREIESYLGVARYRELERAMDPQFRAVYQVAGRFGRDRNATLRAFEVAMQGREQYIAVRKGNAVEFERKPAVLQAIREETRKELARWLGQDGVRAYTFYGGEWLRGK